MEGEGIEPASGRFTPGAEVPVNQAKTILTQIGAGAVCLSRKPTARPGLPRRGYGRRFPDKPLFTTLPAETFQGFSFGWGHRYVQAAAAITALGTREDNIPRG